MNLIDGALERSRAAAGASAGGTSTCRLSPAVLSAPELEHEIEASGEVKLGLRPEHIRIGQPGADGGIPGIVRFLEPVGSDLYLTVEAGGTTVQVRTDPDARVQPGRQRDAPVRRLACARVRRGRPQPPPRRPSGRVGRPADPGRVVAVASRGGSRRGRRRLRARAAEPAPRSDRLPHGEPGEGGDPLPGRRHGAASRT